MMRFRYPKYLRRESSPDDDPVTGSGVGKLETRGCCGCVSGKQGATREVDGATQGTDRMRTKIRAGKDKVEAIKTYFCQKININGHRTGIRR
jgi:hypothetical protein